jgi:TonB family protein
MEAFSLYLIKSVVWLTGFAIVYFLFLRNERFFVLNRIFLIAGILTAFIFPFISIHYTVVLPVGKSTQVDSNVVNYIQSTNADIFPNLRLLFLVLYTSGILFVVVQILRQGRRVLLAIKKSEVINLHQVKLIKTPEYTTAFSIFSYVFVNPSITEIETGEIMNHEMVHIRQKHWLDLALVQLLCILQWFNPLAWMYVRFMRQNHEYLADAVAQQRTSDPAVYRAALLNQIVGAPVISLANSFNYSLNKKRFIMMKNIIRSPFRKMKILLILPVFAIVLYAFAKPDYKYKSADESPAFNGQATAFQTKEVKGTIVQQDGTALPGAIITLKGTTIGTLADANGSFSFGNVPEDGLLVVSFVGYKSKVLKPVFTSEMTVRMVRDTVKYSNINIGTPPPPPPPPPMNEIKENTVVIPETSPLPPTNEIEEISGIAPPPPPPPPAESGISIEGNNPPLVVIDGVVNEKESLKKINPEDIKIMSVLKDEEAIKKYGDKGKNGVIEVTTYKDGEKRPEAKVVKSGPGEAKTGKQPVEVTVQTKAEKDAFVVVEELPEFKGGKDAMAAWINSNLKYPADAVKNKITGKVLVNFLVTTKGKIEDVVVIKSLSPVLDAEAKRVISSMPDWKPGMQAGKNVPVQMQVPVEFKLN